MVPYIFANVLLNFPRSTWFLESKAATLKSRHIFRNNGNNNERRKKLYVCDSANEQEINCSEETVQDLKQSVTNRKAFDLVCGTEMT